MKESSLFAPFIFLLLSKESHSAFEMASPYALDQTTTSEDSMIMPFHLKHPPDLLNSNACFSFLFSVFLCLTIQVSNQMIKLKLRRGSKPT